MGDKNFKYRTVGDIVHAATELEYITGLTIDELLSRFKAGWLLEPPITKVNYTTTPHDTRNKLDIKKK